MRVISLGWGRQSWALAAMVALGEPRLLALGIDRVDAAVHADTTHERSSTYQFAETWGPWLESRGVSVVTVRAERPRFLDGRVVMIPAFTKTERLRGGRLRRQCTKEWKVRPVRRWVRGRLERGGVCEVLLGITTDEATRIKPADVRYLAHRWPLVEMGMSRADVESWLAERALPVPVKSACYFCPFHSGAEWRDVLRSEDGPRAVAVDAAIRNRRPPYPLFLSRQLVPIGAASFGESGSWDEECSGSCGL